MMLSYRLSPEELSVLLCERSPFLRKIVKRKDRRNRTDRNARAAIDAFYRIDVQHFGVGETCVVLLRMDAIDRASVYTRRVLGPDAGFCNYVSHMCGIFKNTI
jgi:hypothetical protein